MDPYDETLAPAPPADAQGELPTERGPQARVGSPLATPTRIGRYAVVGRIGSGGMGSVFEASDPELGRTVAIKVLLTRDMGSDAAARLRREARTLAKLSHPNLVPIYDVGDHDGQLFIVMERIHGHTLSQWAIEQPRGPNEVAVIMAQVARGLGKAHRAGVVHRDVKPSNVMVDDEGRVRVLDFGIARLVIEGGASGDDLSLHTGQGQIIGTPAYMAPEQVAGSDVGPAADVFSFGVVLFELLSGQRPFDAPSLGGLFVAILQATPTKLPDSIPGDLRALVAALLSKSPNERPTDMDEVAANLDRIAMGSSVSIAVDRTPRATRRVGLIAGAVGLAALLGFAGWSAFTAATREPPAESLDAPEPGRANTDASPAEPWRQTPLSGSLAPRGFALTLARSGEWKAFIDAAGAHYVPLRGGDGQDIQIPDARVTTMVGARDEGVLVQTEVGRVYAWNPRDGTAQATFIESNHAAWSASPDGSMVLSWNPGGDELSLWHFADERIETIPGSPFALAWGSDSKSIALATIQAGQPVIQILEVNPIVQGRSLGQIADLRAFQWSGEELLYCTTLGSFSRLFAADLDPTTGVLGSPRQLAEFSGECWGLWSLDDGSVVAQVGAPLETWIGSLTDSDSELIPLKPGLSPLGWSKDGVVVSGRTYAGVTIEVVTPALGSRRIFSGALDPGITGEPVWLGDELGVLFTTNTGRGWIVEADGEVRTLGGVWQPKMTQPQKYAIYPTGERALYLGTWSPPRLELYGMDLAQEKLERLFELDSPLGAETTSANWTRGDISPDGKAIAMAVPIAGPDSRARIQVIDVEKQSVRLIDLAIEDLMHAQHVAWLPGNRGWLLTGTRVSASTYCVWLVSPTGEGRVLFSSPDVWFFRPRVSPDGTTVAVGAKPVRTSLLLLEPNGG